DIHYEHPLTAPRDSQHHPSHHSPLRLPTTRNLVKRETSPSGRRLPPVARSYPVIFPKSPCDSSSGPAVKKSVFVGPALAPLPNSSAHRPSIVSWWPFSRSSPSCVYVPLAPRAYALIWPSPKFPTSRSPLKRPTSDGACASPHGAFSWPGSATRATRCPDVSNSSTKPSRWPSTASSPAASCFAKVTKTCPPIAWIPKGA